MHKARAAVLPCLFCVVFLFFTTESQATVWEQAGSFPYQISAMRFTSPLRGFVGTGTTPGSLPAEAHIYYTTDGGKTWTISLTPNGYAAVTDIFFTNDMIGWAAVGGGKYTLWKTVDGGKSFSEVEQAKGTFAVGVYQTPYAIVVTDLMNDSRISTDGGITFNRTRLNSAADAMMGIDFVDEQHGVIPGYRNGGKWVRTNDGGRSWIESNVSIECWSVYGVKGTSTFFTAEEGNNNGSDYRTKIRSSNDYGANWNVVTELPFRTTGHITGVNDVLYIQTAGDLCYSCTGYAAGLYRSVDSGKTWTAIGGPDNAPDRRFSAVANDCSTITVFAADDFGNIFRLIDTVKYAEGNHLTYNAASNSEPVIQASAGQLYDVTAAVYFPPSLRIDTISAQSIEFSLWFDAPMISITEELLLRHYIPPFGWTFVNGRIDGNTAIITIENSGSKQIALRENLGVIRLLVNNDEQKYGAVGLHNVRIAADCMIYEFICLGEGEHIQQFRLSSSAVRSDVAFTNHLDVFPNPASTSITVSTDDVVPNGHLIIRDLRGIEALNLPINQQRQSFDVSMLASGSYFVSIVSGDSIHSKRIEIIR